jgi:hypothetical protein
MHAKLLQHALVVVEIDLVDDKLRLLLFETRDGGLLRLADGTPRGIHIDENCLAGGLRLLEGPGVKRLTRIGVKWQ